MAGRARTLGILIAPVMVAVTACGGSSAGTSVPQDHATSSSSATTAFATSFDAACTRALQAFPSGDTHTARQFTRQQHQFFRGDAMLTQGISGLGSTPAEKQFVSRLLAGHRQIIQLHRHAIRIAQHDGLKAANHFLKTHPGSLHTGAGYATVRQEATTWGLNQNCI